MRRRPPRRAVSGPPSSTSRSVSEEADGDPVAPFDSNREVLAVIVVEVRYYESKRPRAGVEPRGATKRPVASPSQDRDVVALDGGLERGVRAALGVVVGDRDVLDPVPSQVADGDRLRPTA